MKHCTYGHSVATLQNPLGGTTVSHEYSLTVARYTTVVVAVPSTVRYHANYRIKTLFRMKFKYLNEPFTLIMHCVLLKVASYKK
jgi:hypothetical protein